MRSTELIMTDLIPYPFLVDLHFGKNRDERQRGRVDLNKAKEIYLREVEESGLLSKSELRSLYVN